MLDSQEQWQQVDQGWKLNAHHVGELEIKPNFNSYRLTVTTCNEYTKHKKCENIWETSSLEECFEIAHRYIEHSDWMKDFIASADAAEKTLSQNSGMGRRDLSGVILKTSITDIGRNVLAYQGKKLIGQYCVRPTSFYPTLATGELTVNSSQWLEGGWQGTGLAWEIYSFIEETWGLPAVPHGMNLVEYDRSASAREFWDKRAVKQRVPGWNDPEAARLVQHIQTLQNLFKAETRSNRFNPLLINSIAQIIEQPIILLNSYDQKLGLKTELAAVCMEDGRLLSGDGFTSRKQMKETLRTEGQSHFKKWSVPKFRTKLAKEWQAKYDQLDERDKEVCFFSSFERLEDHLKPLAESVVDKYIKEQPLSIQLRAPFSTKEEQEDIVLTPKF